MTPEESQLRLYYQEAVRLHLYYAPSKFSETRSKSNELAARYHKLANQLYLKLLEERMKQRNGDQG